MELKLGKLMDGFNGALKINRTHFGIETTLSQQPTIEEQNN